MYFSFTWNNQPPASQKPSECGGQHTKVEKRKSCESNQFINAEKRRKRIKGKKKPSLIRLPTPYLPPYTYMESTSFPKEGVTMFILHPKNFKTGIKTIRTNRASSVASLIKNYSGEKLQ